jgi:hypothetical protein
MGHRAGHIFGGQASGRQARRRVCLGVGYLVLVWLLLIPSSRAAWARQVTTPGRLAHSAAAAHARPNRFVLQDSRTGTSITYSTSSSSGKPRFSYRDSRRRSTFIGKEIRTTPSEIGTLVTVTLEAIPDLRVVTLTLLLPEIHLPSSGRAAFTTMAIVTTARTTIGGPGLINGAVQSYRTLTLRGTAQFVVY